MSKTAVLRAGAESGSFTIWRHRLVDGTEELSMTGALADEEGMDDVFFPPTRATMTADLVEQLENLPGWNPIPTFMPAMIDAEFFTDIDRVFAARYPQLWDERRSRWARRVRGSQVAGEPPGRTARSSSVTRLCGLCGGPLEHKGGTEKASHERGGNASATDGFQCYDCGRRFSHSYDESFSGDQESWSVREGSRWVALDREQWPK